MGIILKSGAIGHYYEVFIKLDLSITPHHPNNIAVYVDFFLRLMKIVVSSSEALKYT